jgi:rhodanese-related sulfurtransferase
MTTHRALKTQLFEAIAAIGKAVASAVRLEILDLLAQGERNVEEIARETDQTVKNASAHLGVLRQARVVEVRREGRYQYYSLAGDDVFDLVRAVQSLARQRLAEVEQIVGLFYEDPDQLEPVGAQELRRRLYENEVVVLDVRPPVEYAAGHIPTARSIPIEELASRLGELPSGREIVAYCRGPYCLFSVEAVELLRRHGYRARRLDDGLPDWRRRGFPVATARAGGA